ncbi:hypothetical protein PR202_gb26409 [Eleusine coracana subsp. coracana]|uniref:Uncharacterized protein n=1 Tax=Eleusine coracana subsp. coracana TaxID=191504 RepID=A0AAV5FNU3_ELECO|nr:hypothetical protein PR202_gb26409 [Eleusine coracana subsp. coracana]
MVGSVGSLYASVQKLDSTYLLPGAVKTSLLRPAVASPAMSNNSSLLLPVPSSEPAKKFFRCSFYQSGSCYDYVTEASGTSCPTCRRPMTKIVHYVPPGPSSSEQQLQNGKGFVQGVVTYTVTDDLDVTPMSAISSISLLNTFAVTDLSALQEVISCIHRVPLYINYDIYHTISPYHSFLCFTSRRVPPGDGRADRLQGGHIMHPPCPFIHKL